MSRAGSPVAGDSPSSLADRILITLTGNIFPPAATLVMTPILARSLGVDRRGQLASVTSPYLLLVTLASFGVPSVIYPPRMLIAIREYGTELMMVRRRPTTSD